MGLAVRPRRVRVLWAFDPNGSAAAIAINNANVAVGWSEVYDRADGSARRVATFWPSDPDPTSGESVGQPLVGLSEADAQANDVNDSNQVAGWSATAAGYAHAVLWTLR
jgi:hypothetical protein